MLFRSGEVGHGERTRSQLCSGSQGIRLCEMNWTPSSRWEISCMEKTEYSHVVNACSYQLTRRRADAKARVRRFGNCRIYAISTTRIPEANFRTYARPSASIAASSPLYCRCDEIMINILGSQQSLYSVTTVAWRTVE